jgi:hypothetical protein
MRLAIQDETREEHYGRPPVRRPTSCPACYGPHVPVCRRCGGKHPGACVIEYPDYEGLCSLCVDEDRQREEREAEEHAVAERVADMRFAGWR